MTIGNAQNEVYPTLGYANCWEDAHVLCEALRPRSGARILSVFRRFVLPLIHRRSLVLSALEERSRAEREHFYEEVWNNARWRFLFRIFFSRSVMRRLGRQSSTFRYVKGNVVENILARARHALVELPTHTNPFLEYIATGIFCRSMPRYLEPDRFEMVREGLDRVTLVAGRVEEAARAHGGEGFDGFNLSDLFEYMSEPAGRDIHTRLMKCARPGARIAYWNMMVPRRFAQAQDNRIVELAELAKALHAVDLGFFYGAFVVEEAGA